ncbi:hypothetical protein QVD17_14624 [Tagetes erecta]|uniref:Uncharacterized protein n=1 Tax=Tagetes erecta TaxID=13708 RepID=A0AAD8NYU0_TARER|nr:hypothetical protein QVD17_14624 [Tagetes erecta]
MIHNNYILKNDKLFFFFYQPTCGLVLLPEFLKVNHYHRYYFMSFSRSDVLETRIEDEDDVGEAVACGG